MERLEGAADFALRRAGRTTLVSAKRWKAARHGEEALKALYAAAQERGAGSCVFMALGQLSDNAQAFAKSHGVQVMQAAGLAQVLRGLKLPA